jgi:serine/threonine protein kinase
VCKLENVFNFNPLANPTTWRQDEGPTVGQIMTPPAATVALTILADWKTYRDTTAFLSDSMHQIAFGLAYVHGLNVLHRDIKPDNIVYRVVDPVHAIIIDFGCSSSTPRSTRHDRGTVSYLAPEVMRIKTQESKEPFSFPLDVWSLEVTLLDLLHGKKFDQKLGTEACYQNFKKIIDAHVGALHFPEFWDLTLELLAWDPDSRPTAVEIAARFPGRIQGESQQCVRDEHVPSKRAKS